MATSLSSLKAFMPQTLMGRSLLILVLPVLLIQIGAAVFFFDNHWDKITERLAYALAGEIAIAADQIENNYSPEQFQKTSGYMAQNLDVLIAYDKDLKLEPVIVERTFFDKLVIDPLVEALDAQVRRPTQIRMDLEEKWIEVKVQLSNGVLTVLSPERRLFSSSGYVFILWLFGTTFMLLIISVLFMRNQVRPIRKLAIAAHRLGMGRDLPPNFRPSGAREVRQAAEAFETMNRRIRRQIEQRTAMLAGVSHDLRTPLTRLKLQLSMAGDSEDIQDMKNDIHDMERMINAYLIFAKGERQENAQLVDLKSFVGRVVENFGHERASVELNVIKASRMSVQPLNLQRCLENIISNACKYGTKVLVTLDEKGGERVYIIIEDNGPGMRDDQYDEAVKPFVRLDPSRSADTGGVGLGLSVALDIMLAHGGKLKLSKSETLGGLKVTLSFPK